MSVAKPIEGGQLVGGVWLPASEIHLVDMMLHDPKAKIERDGKLTYQIRKLDAAMKQVPMDRRRVAVDIGAHVGLWSMWLAKLFRFVEAFEPVPLHRELFEHNVSGSYRLHAVALGDHDGRIDMEVPHETTGNAHVAIGRRHPGTRHVPHPDRQYRVEGIPLRTLDSFGLEDVDFVKIDVEGYELAVIRGARETLLRCRPALILEQKGCDHAYGHERDAAVAELDRMGFQRISCMNGDWIVRWPT